MRTNIEEMPEKFQSVLYWMSREQRVQGEMKNSVSNENNSSADFGICNPWGRKAWANS